MRQPPLDLDRPPPPRRLRTQNDITSALEAPPVEDLTRPEVRLPVDVPPDDLTEMHEVYSGGDGDSASLPNEAPFGAHIEPDDARSGLAGLEGAFARPAPRGGTPVAEVSAPASSVTRVRTRAIAVDAEPASSWSSPPRGSQAPRQDPSASTPPSVMVSPSLAPSYPAHEGWGPRQPAWPAPDPARPSHPPQGLRQGPYGTVEMSMLHAPGSAAPQPYAPPQPASGAPAPAAKPGVGRGVWALVALGLLACLAMMAYARLRG
ncbi:MAG: hypothetical protein R3A48_06925 [Polyangiales bacterium]